MKYISEFRNFEAAQALCREIEETAGGRVLKIMEVCGGHTMSIHKYGLPTVLPKNIHLLSGPGCPVCVTANGFIDRAIGLSRQPDVLLATFGDLIKVPGSESSLAAEKARGADVRICYSPLDALELARTYPGRRVVFLGIGFETTAPTIAAALQRAKAQGLANFFVLCAFKTMPQAMRALVENEELDLDGIICPGHVSIITGLEMYRFLAKDYKTPCVVSGFEPLDLLQSILMITRQVREGRAEVENQYIRGADWKGNAVAQRVLDEVFVACDVEWRGLGLIPLSGLALSPAYAAFDAERAIPVQVVSARENPGCICGAIMRGVKRPGDCKLFNKACTPETPKGACMVSEEGSCATYYKYAR